MSSVYTHQCMFNRYSCHSFALFKCRRDAGYRVFNTCYRSFANTFSRSFCSRSSFGWGFSFLLFCFRLSFRDGLILSFTFFNFCFLLIFLSFSRFRNDGLSFSIKFEHVWFLSKTLGNLINSSVDHIDEAFK